MASRESGKNSGKTINQLSSDSLNITLTDYQLSRIRSGCTSLPIKKDLYAVALAHTINKSLKGVETGDVFTRVVYTKYHNTDDALPEGPAVKKSRRGDSLFGPVEKLNPDWTRVVTFKQAAGDDADEPDKEFYIYCIYDGKNACFIDEKGNCLYVKRDQLLAQPYSP